MRHPALNFLEGKRDADFSSVRKGIGFCSYCPDICERKAQPSPGRIPVLFVGEAPSKIGTLKNDVFRGIAYRLMKRWKGEVYETNAILCLSNPPHPRHIGHCRSWLHMLIRSIEPQAVIAFGNVATDSLMSLRKGWSDPLWTLHCMPHPCWVVRANKSQPWREKKFVEEVESILGPHRASS